jgi:glycosyltransferase involved in cell wall biosynthesis
VIISDKVNIWREVQAAKAGRVIPCDAAVLADQILEILANPELAGDMSRKGRGLVLDSFNWTKIGWKLVGVYARIIDQHRCSRSKLPQETPLTP